MMWLDVYARMPLHLHKREVESELHHVSLEDVSNFNLGKDLQTAGKNPKLDSVTRQNCGTRKILSAFPRKYN